MNPTPGLATGTVHLYGGPLDGATRIAWSGTACAPFVTKLEPELGGALTVIYYLWWLTPTLALGWPSPRTVQNYVATRLVMTDEATSSSYFVQAVMSAAMAVRRCLAEQPGVGARPVVGWYLNHPTPYEWSVRGVTASGYNPEPKGVTP